MCQPHKQKYWTFGCGTFFLLIAVLLGLLWPLIVKKVLHYEMELRDGSIRYKHWMGVPIPMYAKFKMFNWTNPEDIHKPNYKPNLVEMGPYVFLEKRQHVNVSYRSQINSVSYDKIRTWHFMPEMSNGTLDDKVTNVNVIAATTAFLYRYSELKVAANSAMKGAKMKLAVTKTVGELLFAGYDDPFLSAVSPLPIPKPPFKKFGWFVDRNGSWSYDGNFEMRSGQSDITQMGNLLKWKYVNTTKYYHGECSKVRGSTGELWPFEMNATADISIFVPDLCRPLTLGYQKDETLYGVTGSKWVGDYRTFDNGQNYEPNSCYCTGKVCPDLPPGVHNMSDCQFGAPIFASFPHFYLGDQSYVDAVTGLAPNQKDHEFSLALEPTTGTPLRVDAKIQTNTLIQPIEGFMMFKNVPTVMIPAFWLTQSVELTEELAGQVKLAMRLPSYGLYVAYGIGALSIILLLVGVALAWFQRPSRIDQNWNNDPDYMNITRIETRQ